MVDDPWLPSVWLHCTVAVAVAATVRRDLVSVSRETVRVPPAFIAARSVFSEPLPLPRVRAAGAVFDQQAPGVDRELTNVTRSAKSAFSTTGPLMMITLVAVGMVLVPQLPVWVQVLAEVNGPPTAVEVKVHWACPRSGTLSKVRTLNRWSRCFFIGVTGLWLRKSGRLGLHSWQEGLLDGSIKEKPCALCHRI